MPKAPPKYLAEAVGTFCLVFAGTAAIVCDQATGGRVTGLGIGLVFGLAVMAMVYSVGHLSGAHLNPAVTLGFFAVGRMPWAEVPGYLAAQAAGALAGSAGVKLVFLESSGRLGMTLPSGTLGQAFVMELILTFILMFVIMGVATDDRAQGSMAGLAIGATIAFEAILGGPVSGASMNPFRSLAPALLCGSLEGQWIYLVAPALGAIAGAWTYRAVK